MRGVRGGIKISSIYCILIEIHIIIYTEEKRLQFYVDILHEKIICT